MGRRGRQIELRLETELGIDIHYPRLAKGIIEGVAKGIIEGDTRDLDKALARTLSYKIHGRHQRGRFRELELST